MAFNIHEFRSNLKYDGARPSLFNVSMTFPQLVQNTAEASRQVTFLARSASLPGHSIGSINLPYFSRDIKVAGDRSFSGWTITVIQDEDFALRNAFQRWSGIMNRFNSNTRHADAVSMFGYQTDISVIQYGKAGNTIKTMKLIGAFPTDVSPIQLDWGSKDQVEEFTVSFEYQVWEDETTD